MTTLSAAKLTQRDRDIAALVANGMTEEATAQQIGVSRATISRTKQKPGFRELVATIRDDAAERIVGALGEVAVEAVEQLRALVRKSPAAVQLGAVRTTLEFLIRGREHTELARRIADLERADAGTDDPPTEPAVGTEGGTDAAPEAAKGTDGAHCVLP